MNDRYRTEQTGSTRKSAAAAKPKRDAGQAAGAPVKPKDKKKSLIPKIEASEQTKKLRRYWWVLIGVALVLAFVAIPLQKMPPWSTVTLVLYGAALIGAFYLEFGPIRKSRLADVEAMKPKGKGKGKADKS